MIRKTIAFLLPIATTFGAALEMPRRSVSSSEQFVVYADSGPTRSKIAIRAEDLKKEFLDLLQVKENPWKVPIILNIGAPPPNKKRPPKSQFGVYEGDAETAKIQIDVFDLSHLDSSDFDAQILTAVALEYAYRNTPILAGRSFEMPPPWLAEGVLERLQAKRGGVKASLYSSLLAGGKTPKLESFLDTDPARLDPTSRAIYRAQSAAFIEALLDLPEGRKGLREFLSAPRKARGALNDLPAAFPSLQNDREQLGRKWLLAIARASASNRVDPLSTRETATQLAEILDVKPLPDPKHPEVAAMSGPYALETIARSQGGPFILAQTADSLLRLSIRAHPLYKPVVDEYLSIVRELAARPKRRVDKRISAAEQMRAALTQQTTEMNDYIDWVEATQLREENEDVAAAVIEVEAIQSPPPRTDAITRYIDAVAERGW
mgnify:CR=1 FL=1